MRTLTEDISEECEITLSSKKCLYMIDIPNDKKLNDIVIYSKGSRGDIEQC